VLISDLCLYKIYKLIFYNSSSFLHKIAIKQIKPKRLNSGTESGGGIGLTGTDGGAGLILHLHFTYHHMVRHSSSAITGIIANVNKTTTANKTIFI